MVAFLQGEYYYFRPRFTDKETEAYTLLGNLINVTASIRMDSITINKNLWGIAYTRAS